MRVRSFKQCVIIFFYFVINYYQKSFKVSDDTQQISLCDLLTLKMLHQLAMTFKVSVKNIEPRAFVDGKSSGSFSTRLARFWRLMEAKLVTGKLKFSLLHSFPSISQEYTGEIVEMLSEQIDCSETNETKVCKENMCQY